MDSGRRNERLYTKEGGKEGEGCVQKERKRENCGKIRRQGENCCTRKKCEGGRVRGEKMDK